MKETLSEEEKEQMLEDIVKNTIHFRIDPAKAESLIEELTELELKLGPELSLNYPTLYPLREWLEILLTAFKAERTEEEYLKLIQEKELPEEVIQHILKKANEN